MPDIFVDADACPVKDETYRVARRYDLRVFVVSNTWLATPEEGRVERVLVGDAFDAADDWVAGHVGEDDVVITSDIPLAARCLEKGARVLGPKGVEFTEDSIGRALASRALLSELREMGEMTGGPAPFERRDRSLFLQALDRIVQAIRRRRPR
ncbi:MAG: YaiI/YqxD family protein [Planctomycetota bacterium]